MGNLVTSLFMHAHERHHFDIGNPVTSIFMLLLFILHQFWSFCSNGHWVRIDPPSHRCASISCHPAVSYHPLVCLPISVSSSLNCFFFSTRALRSGHLLWNCAGNLGAQRAHDRCQRLPIRWTGRRWCVRGSVWCRRWYTKVVQVALACRPQRAQGRANSTCMATRWQASRVGWYGRSHSIGWMLVLTWHDLPANVQVLFKNEHLPLVLRAGHIKFWARGWDKGVQPLQKYSVGNGGWRCYQAIACAFSPGWQSTCACISVLFATYVHVDGLSCLPGVQIIGGHGGKCTCHLHQP